MGLILDTCVFISYERTRKEIDFSIWESYGGIYISAITVSELLVGVHRANDESKRLKRSAFVETILNEIPILDFNIECARIHAEIYAYLSQKGEIIGSYDSMIAATAVRHGYALFTLNEKEFKRVPGLNVLSF